MADQQASAEQSTERKGREGGRWINERPTASEFSTWFETSMKIDPALDIEDYIGGVVLIPAVDSKSKHVTGFQNGQPVIEERPELSFIPYAKVETRTNYFWDLLEAHKADWVGIVQRVTPPRLTVEEALVEEIVETYDAIAVAEGMSDEARAGLREIARSKYAKPSALATMVHQLPEGFSLMSVPVGQGYSHFLCCTVRVAIYDKTAYETDPDKAVPLRAGQGTKQVPLLKSFKDRVWADDNSLMKAETGALGRALGFAGIFVIPGSGVATAEDMFEAIAQGETPTSEPAAPAETNQGPAAPEAVVQTGAEQAEDEETQLRNRAKTLWKELSDDFPEVAQHDFGKWARSRNLHNLSDAHGAMLKGVVKKIEKLLDDAKAKQKEGGDVPAETPADEPDAAAPEGSEDSPAEAIGIPTEEDEEGVAADGEPSGQAD